MGWIWVKRWRRWDGEDGGGDGVINFLVRKWIMSGWSEAAGVDSG